MPAGCIVTSSCISCRRRSGRPLRGTRSMTVARTLVTSWRGWLKWAATGLSLGCTYTRQTNHVSKRMPNREHLSIRGLLPVQQFSLLVPVSARCQLYHYQSADDVQKRQCSSCINIQVSHTCKYDLSCSPQPRKLPALLEVTVCNVAGCLRKHDEDSLSARRSFIRKYLLYQSHCALQSHH
jgi:hypothetical protein